MGASGKEATVIVFDCGSSTAMKCGEETFFDISKTCLKKILQRKIFAKPDDQVGLIFMGTNESSNDLNAANPAKYKNIIKAMNLTQTSWEMLELLENHLKICQADADWTEALEVALDFLEKETRGKKLSNFQIVLITTFCTLQPLRGKVDDLAEAVRRSGADLSVITHNLQCISEEEVMFSQKEGKSASQQAHEEAIEKLIDDVDGIFCTFSNALPQLTYFQQKKTRAMPWNCDLTIGSRLKIQISAFLYTKKATYLKPWKTVSEYTEEQARTNYQHFKGGEQFEPQAEELIKAYMYGSTVVPYDTDLDVSFKTSGKCLMCIGFTAEKYVRQKLFSGTGSNVILPRKASPVDAQLFTSLVKAMKSLGVVMIARRVYNVRSNPKMMVLIPSEQKGVDFLSMIELPFGDGVVDVHFSSFCDKKTEPSAEQLDAVDKLIDAMDLMEATEDGQEAFSQRNTLNLPAQFQYRLLTARALNPSQPLPSLSEDLKEHLTVPQKIRSAAQEAAEGVKSVFELTPKQQTKKDLWLKKLFKPVVNPDEAPAAENADEDPARVLSVVESSIVEVGTVTPAEDFAFLMHRGEKFSSLCAQIQAVISSLVFSATVLQREKVVKAMVALREGSKVMHATYNYNDWITEFKNRLVERKKGDFWTDVIVQENLGLVSAAEHSDSTITEEEAKVFYEIDTEAATATASGTGAGGNVDDLFDDM
ncbi:X-ray repair cross-complementing protein 5 [Phlebotomus argentipes]|uniref:X-ray repair cross-complementing protein 5 n=1 Tax=Phlebotomus argentipes TaxID=94469 RepID=UPI0028931334|nr:X-ray repair cross-complementing protein 5 [Phlebotomus argentipes]